MTDADVLFTAHRDGIFRYLCRIVGNEDARELTQEVFLRVTRAGSPHTDEGGRRAWLFRIARNLAQSAAQLPAKGGSHKGNWL